MNGSNLLAHISSLDDSLSTTPRKAISPCHSPFAEKLNVPSRPSPLFCIDNPGTRDSCDKDPAVTQRTNFILIWIICRVLPMSIFAMFVCERRMARSDTENGSFGFGGGGPIGIGREGKENSKYRDGGKGTRAEVFVRGRRRRGCYVQSCTDIQRQRHCVIRCT